MNCIQVTKDFRITSNRYCWQVEKYAGIDSKAGKQKWTPQTYHPSLESAAASLSQRLFRESEAHTIAGLQKAAETARDIVRNAVFAMSPASFIPLSPDRGEQIMEIMMDRLSKMNDEED